MMTLVRPVPCVVDGHILRVFYTADARGAEEWIRTHFPCDDAAAVDGDAAAETRIMGLDVEWRPQFARNSKPQVALVQMATVDGNVLLFHVRHSRGCTTVLPAALQAALESEAVYKCGVGVVDDARKLYSEFGVKVASCVEVSKLVMWRGDDDMCSAGLARLGAFYLGLESWKSKKITMSNWERSPLTDAQRRYAAIDAWCSAALLRHINAPETVLSTHRVHVSHAPPSARRDGTAYVDDCRPPVSSSGGVDKERRGRPVALASTRPLSLSLPLSRLVATPRTHLRFDDATPHGEVVRAAVPPSRAVAVPTFSPLAVSRPAAGMRFVVVNSAAGRAGDAVARSDTSADTDADADAADAGAGADADAEALQSAKKAERNRRKRLLRKKRLRLQRDDERPQQPLRAPSAGLSDSDSEYEPRSNHGRSVRIKM